MPSKRFTCPACERKHVTGETPHALGQISPSGALYCAGCGELWYVAICPNGVVPRRNDETHTWLINHMTADVDSARTILRLIADYVAHADQHISLEEPVSK